MKPRPIQDKHIQQPTKVQKKGKRQVEGGSAAKARAAAAIKSQSLKIEPKPIGSPEHQKKLEDAFKALQNMYPEAESLGFDFNVLLEKINNQSLEQQTEFVELVENHVAAKNKKPEGWLGWMGSLTTQLKDRVVRRYQYGKGEFEFLAEVFGHIATISAWKARSITESAVTRIESSYIPGGILLLANTSLASIGNNIILPLARKTIPVMTKYMLALAELDAYEGISKEVVENYLNAVSVSERPIQNLTAATVNTFDSWIREDLWKKLSPYAVLAKQGRLEEAFSSVLEKGSKVVPELLVAFVLKSEFGGPQVHPLAPYYPEAELGTIPGQLSSLQIGILTTCIVTLLRTGSIPIKNSLIKVLSKGPASLKQLGVKELVKTVQKLAVKTTTKAMNPMLDPVFQTFLTTAVDYTAAKTGQAVKKPIKGLIKTTLATTIDRLIEEEPKEKEKEEVPLPLPVQQQKSKQRMRGVRRVHRRRKP